MTSNNIKTDLLKKENDLKKFHLYKLYTMDEKIKSTEEYANNNNIKITNTIKDKPKLFNNFMVIAQMIKESGECRYFYGKKDNMIKFIEDNKNSALFEVSTTPYPKVYFDIDKIEMDDKSIKMMVLELMEKYNNDFNKCITFNDVIVLGKLIEKSNKYKSLHIIFKTESMCKKILKWWVNQRNNGGCVRIDPLVYKSKQNLCLKDNTKYNNSNNPVFTDIFKSHNTTDYLIEFNNDNPITEHQDYIEYIKKETERKKDLQTLTSKSKNIIKVNRFNLVDKILTHLPPNHKFYSSHFWSGLLLTLKANEVKKLDYFMEESVGRAENSKLYTIEKNKEFFNNNETEFKNIYHQITQLNTKYNLRFYWCGNGFYDTPELRDWTMRLSGVDINIINDKFDKVNEKCYENPTKITIKKDVYLDIKNMLFIDLNKKFVCCYWNDYYKTLNKDNTENFIKLEKEEITEKAKEFIDNNNKICGVKMVWGEGKSYYVMLPVIKELMKKDNIKILMITENNALNKDVYLTYNELFEGKVWSHRNKTQTKEDKQIFICSVESITLRLKNEFDFDYIIFDEYETIISHLESETLTNPYQTINNIIKKMENADKIYLLDADLSNERITPLMKRLNTDKVELYESKVNKWRSHKFNIFNNNKNDVLYKLLTDIENNKNICVACMTRREAKIIFKLISSKFDNVNILGYWRDEIYYKLDGEEKRLLTKEEKNKNMNDMIDDANINVWIYSPSIITGISYNKPNYFHKTYLFTSHQSCNARLSIQMLFRVRELIDKEINISFNELKPPTDRPTDKETIDLINCKCELSKTSILNDIHYDMDENENITFNDIYHQFYITNYKEIYMSEYNLGQEILRILTSNHQIPLNFMLPTLKDAEINLSEVKDEYDGSKEKVKMEDTLTFMMTDFKPEKEKEKQHRKNIICNDDFISIREVNKKNALNLLGLNTSYYRKYGERVEMFDKVGSVYEYINKKDYDYTDNNDNQYCYEDKQKIWINYNQDNLDILKYPINHEFNITPFTHLNNIHNDMNIADLLICNENLRIIQNINNFNKYEDETINEDNELNGEINERNFNKKLKRVIKRVLPELFDNNDNIIFKKIQFNHKSLTERLLPHKEEISNNWSILKDLETHKKKNIRLNIDKLKDVDKCYYLIRHLLREIGMTIEAPKNKYRDNETYKITFEDWIKTDYENKERIGEEIRIKNDKLNIDGYNVDIGKNKDIVSKSEKLKPKLFKELGLKKNEKLIKSCGCYKSPSIKIVKIDIENKEKTEKEIKRSLNGMVKTAYNHHYYKVRPVKKNDTELVNIFNNNRVEYKKNKCLIQEDLMEDDLFMVNPELAKALDKNVCVEDY